MKCDQEPTRYRVVVLTSSGHSVEGTHVSTHVKLHRYHGFLVFVGDANPAYANSP